MVMMNRFPVKYFVRGQITSIPACRDAPCNETKRRYFEDL